MEKLPYLRDKILTNIPVVVRITKRVGQYPETDFNTKQPTGRMQTLYNFTMPNGEVVRHYAKEREEETLGTFSAGEEVQVVRQEKKKEEGGTMQFLVWTPTEGAEARLAANPPVQSNTQQTATQREIAESKQSKEEKDVEICLQGFMQAFIIQGKNTEEALDEAEIARFKLKTRARQILERGEKPSSPAPTEKVHLPDHIASAFGEDVSPTL